MQSWLPYPWHALDRLTRESVRLLREARPVLRDALRLDRLAQETTSVLGLGAELVVRDVTSARQPASAYPTGACCLLQAPAGTPAILIELEAELAHRIASQLLARPPRWVDRSRPAPATVQAAVGAACLAVARRACPADPLSLRAIDAEARQQFVTSSRHPVLSVQATLLLEHEPFGILAHVLAPLRPTTLHEPFGHAELKRLGDLPVPLCVVAAHSTAVPAEIATLGVGDAWMPGQGWMLHQEEGVLSGDVALCAAGNELGRAGVLRPDGQIVLGERPIRVENDMEQSQPDEGVHSSGGSIADVIAEAPVVVRVEVGTVVMRAREWATLAPGDVVTTGRRLGERVILRAGGVEIARGELVDVEGELGVRIHEVLTQSQGETP